MSFLLGSEMYAGYSDVDILHGCSIGVERGEVVVVIGPNGAGKSTAMQALFGLLPLRRGEVSIAAKPITDMPPQDRVRAGMSFVPQNNNVFTSLSVQENLEMGAFIREDDISDTLAEVFELFPVLKQKRQQLAGELSGGQRQQVAIGRALMTQPTALMLDEPTAGVSPIVTDQLFARISDIARNGVAVLMVEQNAKQALGIADRGYVLVQGRNRYSDTGAALLANPEVGKAFLGA